MARVLLIDDEPELVEMCAMVLESAGHSIVPHSGQAHALALCAAPDSRPDVVLLDLVMPGMSGGQVLERLREEPHTRDIPVVVMSALPQSDTEAEQLAADLFLGKPFGPDALKGAVEEALAQRQERTSP
jgi:CheY-like chemotaxis protein